MVKRLVTKTGEVICQNVRIAERFDERLLGLMFSKDLEKENGLLISPCNSIHTFFMRYPIDIVFMDKNFKVVKAIYNIKPWRMTLMYWRATQVLEMKAGALSKKLNLNDELVLEDYV